MVTIVICYKAGTGDVLSVCLESIESHTKSIPHKIVILTAKGDVDNSLIALKSYFIFKIQEVELEPGIKMTKAHGAMLDSYIPSQIDTEHVMTLDSDCFPMADRWLDNLMDMMNNGAEVVGILHPWAPPSPDMNKKRIEWRVRSQHCWETTHVACQMMRTDRLRELGAKYIAGDDTGLAVLVAAKAKGWKVDGFKVTRCPKPLVGRLDPEFNRYICLVFGDMMYHHGGWTRTSVCSDSPIHNDEFGWVRERILKERGADWLLDDNVSYKFKFDKEEAIAKEKMDRLFGMKKDAK